MPDAPELQTDDSGNVIVHPLTAYSTSTIEGMSVFLVLEYASDPTGPDEGKEGQLQLLLTPPQCQALGEKLTTLAAGLMRPSGDPPN